MINLIALVKEKKAVNILIKATKLWNCEEDIVAENVSIDLSEVSSNSEYLGNTLLEPCLTSKPIKQGNRIIQVNNLILLDAQLYVNTDGQWYQLAKNKGYLKLKTLKYLPLKSIQC